MSTPLLIILGTIAALVLVFALAVYLRWLLPPPPADWMGSIKEDDTWL